jgi:glycosyltransferase involved in cell wall biosynthesis
MASKGINPQECAPFVSFITPFYNTEQYIAECIESVLAQTYVNWEYILVNNQSTDASRVIAERYAQKDSRIRLLDTPKHLSQIENFEAALRHMSPKSKYCKMVLADDWIFPECVERMVALAEANPAVGIVSSYQLYGDEINGDGLPYSSTVISGRQAGRHMLLDGYYLTGSPTTVLFRAGIVRATLPFFPDQWIHEDTEACFQVLNRHDLGFVHQVLTFSRKNDGSLSSQVSRFNPGPVRKFIFAKKYGPQFLAESEYRDHLRQTTDFCGQFLAESVFQFKGKEFWEFQRRGLRAVGADFWSMRLPKYVLLEIIDIICNPKKTAGRLVRLARARRQDAVNRQTPLPSEHDINR